MNKKFTKLIAALALLVFMTPSLVVWGQTYTQVTELDMTTKDYGTTSYNSNIAYTSNSLEWHIVNGANNGKSWEYFKMGGKSATLANANPCYIYSPAISQQVDKVTVHLPEGSLPKTGMSVNSWALCVYSSSTMTATNRIDSIAGGTITNSENTFDFYPSTNITWAANYYYKVTWNLANTTSTNGIVYVDKITLYKESGGNTPTPNLSVNPASVAFGEKAINPANPYTETFTVTYGNLTENLSVSVGSGLTGVSVDPSTISKDGNGTQQVTVSYNPTAVGNISGNITISNTADNLSKTVAVTGSAYDPSSVVYYEKLTAAPSDWSGVYILTGINSNTHYALTGVNNSNLGTATSVGLTSDGKIKSTTTVDAYQVVVIPTRTVTINNTNVTYYSLYMNGVGYLAYTSTATSQNNNLWALDKFVVGQCEWTLSYTNNLVVVTNVYNSGRVLQFNYNNGNTRFACYTSNQTKLNFFQYQGDVVLPLSLPFVTLEAGNGTITPTWAAVANAQSYTLEWSTSSTFASDVHEVSSTTSGTAISGLTNGTTYYVRVKAIGDGTNHNDSDWSAIVSETPSEATIPTPEITLFEGYSTGTNNEYVDVASFKFTVENQSEYILYYTLDGTDPTTSQTAVEYTYDDEVIIDETTTIKVVATDLTDYSDIAELTVTIKPITPISTVFAAADSDNTYYYIEGIMTYKQSNSNRFVEDETAGILVYGNNSTIAVGDKLIIKGTKTTYNGKPELKNITLIANVSHNNQLPCHEINISQASDYMHRRVKYTQVLVGATSSSVTTISQGNNSIGVYNMPSVTNVTDKGYYLKSITGVVGYYNTNSTNQMYVVSAEDITAYTITASSNNDNFGAVEANGYVITASPAANCSYADPAYAIVNGGSICNVTQTDDDFKVVTNGDATVTINFATTAVLNTVTYHVNGVTNSQEVVQGSELQLSSASAPNGYVFRGWTTSSISGVSATAPDPLYTTSVTVNDNIDLYAVFAISQEVPETWALSNSAPANNDEVILGAVDGDYYYAMNGPSGIQFAVSGNVITGTIPEDAIFTASVDNSTNYLKQSSNYLHFNSSALKVAGSTTNAALTYTANNGGFVLYGTDQSRYMTYNSNSHSFGVSGESDDAETMYIFKRTAATTSYSNYCTLVTILSLGDEVKNYPGACSIDQEYGFVIQNGETLTVGALGNTNAANLLIEDGGQLIHSNSGVQATVVKHINHYTGSRDNYYLLASPIKGEVAATDVTDMLENTYDLYYFDADQETEEWQNYKVNTFAIANEKGYLYANSANVDLEFSGELVPSNEGVTIPLTYAEENAPKFNGWNLVGNPFPCNATPTITDFYVISGTEVQATTYGTVAPCEAIFVNATAATRSVTFSKATAGKNSNLLNISLSKDGANMDKAFVRFGQGEGLPKFMLNADNTKISLDQSGVEYAVVYSEAEAELPVNFKASENGSYTLSVKPEDVDMNYLHLIDNKTGADVDLLATPSYSFEAKTTDYASRFRLVFSANANTAENGNETFAYYNGSEWVIANEGDATLQVVDMMGRVLRSADNARTVSTNDLTPGVYMLRLINSENVRTQKIIVK